MNESKNVEGDKSYPFRGGKITESQSTYYLISRVEESEEERLNLCFPLLVKSLN